MFDLEDMDGMIRCILWPSDFVTYGQMVTDGAIVALRGAIDRRPGSEEANLIVNEILPLSELSQRYTKGIRIRLDESLHSSDIRVPLLAASSGESGATAGLSSSASQTGGSLASVHILNQLHEILRGYPGTCEVELALVLADGSKILLKCNSPKVELCPELRTRLDDLLGPGNVKLIAASPNGRGPNARSNESGNRGKEFRKGPPRYEAVGSRQG
jgi:DNA polymerase-3 subunit alpha